jgi:hypothetical protein
MAADIWHIKAIVNNCRKHCVSMFAPMLDLHAPTYSPALSRDDQVGLTGGHALTDQNSVLPLN